MRLGRWDGLVTAERVWQHVSFMTLRSFARLGAVLLGLAACEGSHDARPGADAASDAGSLASSLRVGTGQQRFEPIEPGQALPLIRGPQGGYHLWVSAEFVAPGDGEALIVTLRVRTLWEGRPETELVQTPLARAVLDDATGLRHVTGWTGQIQSPTCAHGQRVVVEVSVFLEGAEDPLARGEAVVRVQVPAQYRSTSCDSLDASP